MTFYRVPWWMQENRRGRWLRKHIHKTPQRRYNKIVIKLAVLQASLIS